MKTEEEIRKNILKELLLQAFKDENKPRIDALLELGASLDEFNLMYEAARSNDIKLLKFILEGSGNPDLPISFDDIDSSIHFDFYYFAIDHKNKDMIRLLHKHNARIDEKGHDDEKWMTPIDVAVFQGDMEIIELLFELGVKPNSILKIDSLLHNKDILELFIKHGFDVSKYRYDSDGESENITLLGYAVAESSYKNNKDVFHLLIEHGANVDVYVHDFFYYFPHITKGEKKYYRTPSSDGLTLVAIAVVKKDRELLSFLIEAGAKYLDDALLCACFYDDHESAEILLTSGMHISKELLNEISYQKPSTEMMNRIRTHIKAMESKLEDEIRQKIKKELAYVKQIS